MWRLAVGVCAIVLACVAGRVAYADELTEFEKGRNSYSGGRYDEAVERFTQMLSPSNNQRLTDAQLIEQARIYRAASLLAVGNQEAAEKEIETVLRANPSAYPDPVIFPGIVLDRFTEVRGRIRSQLEQLARRKFEQEQERLHQQQEQYRQEQARVRRLEDAARQEVYVVENSRWIAAIPFGVGQFQNRQPEFAWPLLVAQTALVTSTVVTGAIALDLQSKGTVPNVDVHDLNRRLTMYKRINNISFVSLAAVAALGVLHAQLTFEPHRKVVKPRELPVDLRPVTSGSSAPSGATLTFRGAF